MHNAILPSNIMEEVNENLNKEEQRQPSNKELYDLRRKEKEDQRQKKGDQKKVKKTGKYFVYLLILAVAIFGFYMLTKNVKRLPPTSIQNHAELSPPSHIVDTPIPENIQKHMLEHADGSGRPGIIIQYNCNDFECEEDLVAKLTELVRRYPDNVYLAPNTYDGMIILTKFGKRRLLDVFDEGVIKNFIGE